MEEETKNSELENIMHEINRNFSDKPHLQKLWEIFNRGGGTLVSQGSMSEIADINETEKSVTFYGEYKNKARSMWELKPLINYLDREGYRWI